MAGQQVGDPISVRGDPQRPRRRDRRDGRSTLRGSAYSTNIKTRSDFSCAFFDADLRAVAQGVRPAGAPRLDGRSRCRGPCATTGRENLGPGDVIVTNDPVPERRPPQRRQPDRARLRDGELLGYVANLAHHVDVGGGAPASIGAFREVFQEGVIIPPVKLVAGRADRRRRLPADPRADPLQARDRRATSAPRSRRTRPACAGCRRWSTATGARRSSRRWSELLDYTERRTRAASSPAFRHGVLRGRGLRRQRRLHRPAGAAAGAGRAPTRRCPLRPRPAPTRSAARRSTRPTRRPSPPARTCSSA